MENKSNSNYDVELSIIGFACEDSRLGKLFNETLRVYDKYKFAAENAGRVSLTDEQKNNDKLYGVSGVAKLTVIAKDADTAYTIAMKTVDLGNILSPRMIWEISLVLKTR